MDLFVFGKIVKTRGLRGCLKVLSYLESPEILEKLDFVFLKSPSGRQSRHAVKKIDFAGKFIFLEIEDIYDVDQAREYIGSQLLMPRDKLETLPDDEYYWQDIIGLEVSTSEGLSLGRIESIFSTGSNDVYVCRNGKKEYLIPSVADVILDINLNSHKMIVKLIEGLEQ